MDRSRLDLDFVVVGPLRAGTTMLRLILDHHPAIACIGEFEEAVSTCGDSGWPDVIRYRAWLSQDRASLAKRFAVDEGISNYPDLVRSLWRQLADRTGKPIRGCTIHSRIDRIREIWPGAKFIFLGRDPRDVARSCVGMGWVGEASHGARYWLDPVRRWCRLRDQLDPADFVEIRYEDLLREPASVLDTCCRLLGERFDPAMLNFHETSTYEALDPALAEQWRRKMSPRAAEIIDSSCLELMPQFGYEPSVPTPRPAGWAERARLGIENRVGRLRFRVRRYGLRRFLAWSLLKFLRVDHPWRVRLRLKLNEIDRAHLK
jgi:hypothetical protein